MILKMQPVLKDYLWGGEKLKTLFGRKSDTVVAESWEFSVHPDGESKAGEIPFAEYLNENPTAVDKAGNPFPVLIKLIDARSNLSVQVHPNDEFARRVEGDNGKTEMWYILQADEGAGIYCGFSRDAGVEEFTRKIKDGTVEELLNFIPVKAGDCYLIEAGTLHAIGGGCMICEVQQSSNVTYRVYDYNRRDKNGNLRPLHVEKALQVINFKAFSDNTNGGSYERVGGGNMRLLTGCEYFTCRELLLDGSYSEVAENSFRALCVLEGEGEIEGMPFAAGDSFFVPCGEHYTLTGTAKILIAQE